MSVVSFDLDGVVMDNPFLHCVLPRVKKLIHASSALKDLTEDEAEARIDAAIMDEWVARMSRGEVVAAFDWDAIYNLVSRSFDGPPIPDLTAMVEGCREADYMRLLPGVREGVSLLHHAGYRVIALTNGYSHYQAAVLKALDISELFDAVVAPNDVNFAKPDPAIFAGIDGLVAHVGDTLYADVLGARRAGLTTIWLASELPEPLRMVPPALRRSHASFGDFHRQRIDLDPHRTWFPEALPEHLTCDAVVQDVLEAAEAVIEILGPAGPSTSDQEGLAG